MPKSEIDEATQSVAEAEERLAHHSARFETLCHYGGESRAIRKAQARLALLEHSLTLARTHLKLKLRY